MSREDSSSGGKRWRRSEETTPARQPAETFQHRIGSGHNLIRLFELFLFAWRRCEEMSDRSLRVPDRESAIELQAICLELDHRIFREFITFPQTRGGGLHFEDQPPENRQILHACRVMSSALAALKVKKTPLDVGSRVPLSVRKEFVRATEILGLWFSSKEDIDESAVGNSNQAQSRGQPAVQHRKKSDDDTASYLNEFRLSGGVFVIQFADKSISLRNSVGLRFIHRLLQDQGKRITIENTVQLDAAEVDESDHPRAMVRPAVGGRSMAEKALEKVRDRLAEAEGELERCVEDNDLAGQERTQIEIETLRSEISQSVGLRGRPRRTGDPAETARARNGMSFSRAMEKLKIDHEPLYLHLKDAIQDPSGWNPGYLPQKFVPWMLV